MKRVKTVIVSFVFMAIAETGLAGYVFPLLLHFALMPFGAGHLINCGMDYASGGYVVRADHGMPEVSWWQRFVIAAEYQVEALPLFAVLALPASIGVPMWQVFSQRPTSRLMVFLLGAFPGALLVAAVFQVNHGALPMQGPEPLTQAFEAAYSGVLWSWLISRSLLVAIAAVSCTAIINNWLDRHPV